MYTFNDVASQSRQIRIQIQSNEPETITCSPRAFSTTYAERKKFVYLNWKYEVILPGLKKNLKLKNWETEKQSRNRNL